MIKIGYTNHKGKSCLDATLEQQTIGPKRDIIATLRKKASILEDNGEKGPKKAFWKKTNLKA